MRTITLFQTTAIISIEINIINYQPEDINYTPQERPTFNQGKTNRTCE